MNTEIFSTKEITSFLTNAGINVDSKLQKMIKELIHSPLQKTLYGFYIEKYFSADKKDYVVLHRDLLIIGQNDYKIVKSKNKLTITDLKSNKSIAISYFPNTEYNNLGTIMLEMKDEESKKKKNGIDLIQDVLGVKVINHDGTLNNIKIEDGNPKTYLQAIHDCIINTDYIFSDQKFYSKIDLISLAAQEYISDIINNKHVNAEIILAQLKERLETLSSQAEKINTELEQYKNAISSLESTKNPSKGKTTKRKSKKKQV